MAEQYTGAMLCFYLPKLAAEALHKQVAPALGKYALPPEEYHVTLVYLPDFADIPNGRETVIEVLETAGDEDVRRSPLSGRINGIVRFYETHKDEMHALCATFDAVDLPDFRASLLEALQAKGLGFEQTHGYVPHITVGYLPIETPTPDIQLNPIGLTFNSIWFAFNDDRAEFTLDGDAYQSPYAMKRYNDINELPSDMRQSLSPDEQARFVVAYNDAFDETQDDHKAFLAGYGAINRSRVMSRKSASGAPIVDGWGILFTDEENLDSWDTFFSELTSLLEEYYQNAPLWIEHGYDPDYGAKPVGKRIHLEVFRRGVWVAHELHPHHSLIDRTVEDVEKGIYSYSSDSIQHYMEQGFRPNGELREWPLAGFSLVRKPAEPGLGPVSITKFASALKAQRQREAAGSNGANPSIVNIISSSKGQSTMDLQKLAEMLGVEPTPEAVIPALEQLLATLTGDAAQAAPDDAEEVAGVPMKAAREALGLDEKTPAKEVCAKFAEVISAFLPKPVTINFDALKAVREAAENTEKPDPVGFHTPEDGGSARRNEKPRNYGGFGVPSTPKVPKKARANVAAALVTIYKNGGKPGAQAMKSLGYTIGANGGWMPDREVSNELIELFYAKTVTLEAGATKVPMDGIETLDYRKIKGGATADYGAMGQAPDESQMSFGYVSLNLKWLRAATRINNRLLKNASVSLENVIKDDLEKAVALRADLAHLRGTGAKTATSKGAEPLGVKNTPSVTNTILGSGNGANPTILDFVQAWGRIEDANVPLSDSWGIVSSPRTMRFMQNQRDTTGRKLDDSEWTNGYKTHKTTQIPNNTVVGASNDTTEVYLGAWEYLIVGVGMDIEFIVSTEKYVAEGDTYVQVNHMHDCGVSHPEAFQLLTAVRSSGV